MKKQLVISLIQFVIIVICNNAWSQNGWSYDYSYDASGNRIKRVATEILMRYANDSTITDSVNQDQQHNQIPNANNTISNFSTESGNSSNTNSSEVINNNTMTKSDKIVSDDILVYPNPTFGLLNVDINNPSRINSTKIVLYTELGAILMQNEVKDFNSKIDMRKYSSGVYYLKLIRNGNSKTYKIIKEN